MNNLKRVYKIVLNHWQYLTLGLFFMVGFSVFSAVSITFIKPVLDFIFVRVNKEFVYISFEDFFLAFSRIFEFFPSFSQLFSGKKAFLEFSIQLRQIFLATDPFLLLYIVSIAAVLAVATKNIFFYGDKICFGKLKYLTIKDIRDLMFASYTKQSLNFFSKNKVGDSMVRMVNDVDIISNLYIASVVNILRNILIILALVFLAIMVNAKLFFISIIVLPIFPILVGLIGKKIRKYANKIQNKFSDLFSHVEEVLANMRIVKAFGKEEKEREKFEIINRVHLKYELKSLMYNTINTPLSETNSVITIIIIIIIGGSDVLGGSFTLGDFMVFLGAVASILHPLKAITKSYTELKKANVSLERISYILDLKTGIQEKKNALPIKNFRKNILIKDLSFYYDKGKNKILKDINLEIKKGQTIAIVGASGSGKTTLVNLLPRFFSYQNGSIFIDGTPIENFKIKDLRALFGIVTQNSILFTDTIAQNIGYGYQGKATLPRIKKAAKIAFADEFIQEIDSNYEHILTGKGSNLSGGQRQRICIARAIVGNPPILIFDEATSALDTVAEKKVQTAIERATLNRTVFVIAHRLSTVLSADKIVVMEKGQIVGMGKSEALLKSCPQYKNLYELQFKV